MRKSLPRITEEEKPLPEYHETTKPLPKITKNENPLPQFGHPENVVQFGDKEIEIKPTKIKYQRDRTAAPYRLLKQMSVVDLLALQDGVLDAHRSSDKILFDWLIAVTDDSKLVAENYDKLDSETIYKILEIFCRLNHIQDDEEKKQTAQMEKA